MDHDSLLKMNISIHKNQGLFSFKEVQVYGHGLLSIFILAADFLHWFIDFGLYLEDYLKLG